jgi:protein TonB
LSPLNNWKRQRQNKNPLLSTLLLSIGLHGVLLFPFWQLRTAEVAIPERPVRLTLEIPLTERVQAVAPPCRQLNKIMLPQAKRVAKPLVKPVAKPAVKAPVPLPDKVVEKAVEIPEPHAVNPAPPVPKKSNVVPLETKSVIAQTGPPKMVLPAAGKVSSKEAEDSALPAKIVSISPGYLQKIFDRIQKGKRYPRLARDRGIEGAVLLEFVLAHDGKLVDSRVLRSSGFAILDQEALQTVRRATPFPKLPEWTAVGRVTLKMPISFAITD